MMVFFVNFKYFLSIYILYQAEKSMITKFSNFLQTKQRKQFMGVRTRLRHQPVHQIASRRFTINRITLRTGDF